LRRGKSEVLSHEWPVDHRGNSLPLEIDLAQALELSLAQVAAQPEVLIAVNRASRSHESWSGLASQGHCPVVKLSGCPPSFDHLVWLHFEIRLHVAPQ
jgi:hypothetical protein